MADARERPDAAEQDTADERDQAKDKKPAKQTGEGHGTVDAEQVNDHVTPERWDTSRGAEPAMRGTSRRRG